MNRKTPVAALSALVALAFAPGHAAEADSPATIKMSPFEVQVDSDKSYGALNSTSVTQFKVEMDKMPVTADIFTDLFMKDIAATSVEEVVQGYSAGAGMSTALDEGAASGSNNQPGDRNGNAYIQLRGMNTPMMMRDAVMPVGSYANPGSTAVGRTDNFDLERVEVINGPQALLYGGGGAGGVINVTSKQARFGTAPRGAFLYRIDNYGSKRGELDLGLGSAHMALRFSFLRESQWGRRINIGGTTNGQYGQIAFRLFDKMVPTTIRLSATQTMNRRLLPTPMTFTGPATDSRRSLNLHYILATNQEGATDPKTGAPYAAGAILGGKLNWSNVDSFGGNLRQDPVSNDFASVVVETRWAPWLATIAAAGYDDYTERRINQAFSFIAPNTGANTTNNWVATNRPADIWQPARTKSGRVAALITKDLLGGRAATQTAVGMDYGRTDSAQHMYLLYQADSNWNTVVNPSTATNLANLGRTSVPTLQWSLDNGPVLYPFFDPSKDRATVNGVNYVRELVNPPLANLATPANPLGVPNTNNFILRKVGTRGFYATNYTQWLDGRLNTLVGIRQGDYFMETLRQPTLGKGYWMSKTSQSNFNVGIDYKFSDWIHPYATYSDSVQPPSLPDAADPYGNPAKSAHGIGGEAGLKFGSTRSGLSGSLAFYRVSSKDEVFVTNSTILSEINPTGLNGGGGNVYINVDRVTQGVQLQLTAAPTSNWRIRLSASVLDGTIGSTRSYEQLYNDQFYANSAGQVTYKDGAVVFVNGNAATTAQATVVAATAAGATPLTINMMSTPTSLYWANPEPVSGAINSGSRAAVILQTVDASHGPILTGAIQLPIAQLQLNKTLAGINAPGVIVPVRAGDKTTGYPERSVNLTNSYAFSQSWLRGLRVGGTLALGWNNRAYYYYANPVTSANALTQRRTLYFGPNTQLFNGILGYSKRFGRYKWDTQVNINNIFNRYEIRVIPNATTGYNTLTSLNATFYQQPRSYLWTNTVSF